MARGALLVDSFIIRDLVHNWARTILTVLGIALGVAVMLAINLANGTTLSRFKESIDLVAGRTNLQVVATAMPDIDQSALTKLPPLWDQGVKFTPVIDQLAVVPAEKPDVVQVLGVDTFADPAFRPFSYSSSVATGGGGNFSIFNKDTAYVGKRFADKYGLAEGSKFHLLMNDKNRELTVGGVIAYSGPGKTFGGNIIVMDIGPAQEAFDMRGRITRIDMIAPDERIDSVADELRTTMPSGVTVDRPSGRGRQVEKMLAAFQYNLTALSLIALLVGMFVIYNTMSITIIRKRSEIGILRSLGASRRRIFGMFFVNALILGTSGSLLGLAGGLAFSRYAIKAVARTVQALYVDQPPADISVNPLTLLIAFGFGLLMTLVASLGPIMEAVGVAPAEAARRASFERRLARGSTKLALFGCVLLVAAAVAAMLPAVGGFPAFGYASAALTIFGVSFTLPLLLSFIIGGVLKLIRPLFGSEGKLAISSLGSTLGRTSVTVASLMLGISMMVSLAIMIGSFRETVIVWVNQTLKADLYVSPLARSASSRAGRLSDETVDRIRKLPGVEDVDAFVEFPITYNGQQTNLGAGDVDVLLRHGSLMFVGGGKSADILRPLEHENECIVSEAFALRNNTHTGDVLTLQTPTRPLQVKVAGIYYDYASERGIIVLPRWLYRQYFPDLFSSTLGVYVKAGSNLDSVRTEMVNALGNTTSLNIRTNRELREEVLRVFDNTFAITYALHAISILVAILGVMNALFALTFEMRRDFAILTYVGASLKQIRKIILVQAGTLGLLGNVFGLAVGFVLSLLLINVINKQSFGWTVQLSIPVAFLMQSFVLIMLSAILSGWLPARAAAKSISPEAVRVE